MLEGNKADVPTEESLKEISKKYCQTPCSFAESFHFASWIQDIKFGYKNTVWQESWVSLLVSMAFKSEVPLPIGVCSIYCGSAAAHWVFQEECESEFLEKFIWGKLNATNY